MTPDRSKFFYRSYFMMTRHLSLHLFKRFLFSLILIGACVHPLFAQTFTQAAVNLNNASPGQAITYIFNFSNALSLANCADTFESYTVGSSPAAANWASANGTWTEVADNSTTNTTGTQAVSVAAAAVSFPNLLNQCAGQVGDGSIQADIKIPSAAVSQQAVLLWRFAGSDTPAFTNGSSYQVIVAVGFIVVGYYDLTKNQFISLWNLY